MNNKLSLVNLIAAFEKAFEHCNTTYFSGSVRRPVITIQQGVNGKARAYGWVSCAEVWHDTEDKQRAHELNISAEYLNRDFRAIATTLMHEIVHLENMRLGVQDTARSGIRHNQKFAKCAEEHGMQGYKGEDYDKVGWRVKLTDETASELLPALKFLEDEITLCRDVNAKKVKTKAKVIKYTCPTCGATCRATKQISIRCDDCDEPMLAEIEV